MAWDYHRDGTVINEACLRVIRCVTQGIRATDTRYLVRYWCCGETGTLTHGQIRYRCARGRDRLHALERIAFSEHPPPSEREDLLLCADCAKRVAAKRRADWAKRRWALGRDYGCRLPEWPVPRVELPVGWVPWAGARPAENPFRN